MSRRSIEEKIDSMFGTEGADDADDTAPNVIEGAAEHAADEEPSVEADKAPARGQAARQAPDAQRDDDASSSSAQQPGKEQRPADKQGAQPAQPTQRRLPANGNGDLVDPNTGAVIARAGNERRFFEAARHAQAQMQRSASELERVTTELNAFREAAALPRELGLAPAEVSNAMQWFAHWKQNPVEAAKSVLTELRAMGYEVEGLAPTVDLAAIKRMVSEAVSPFTQDREVAQREAEAAQRVDAELNNLYSAMPWAQNQQAEIIALLNTDPTLTLREAALHLQNFALQRGFDLSRSLREQTLTAQNGGTAQPQPQQPPQRPNAARLPAPPTTGDVPIVPRRVTSASHEQRTQDIVLEAMREAGLNVDHLRG